MLIVLTCTIWFVYKKKIWEREKETEKNDDDTIIMIITATTIIIMIITTMITYDRERITAQTPAAAKIATTTTSIKHKPRIPTERLTDRERENIVLFIQDMAHLHDSLRPQKGVGEGGLWIPRFVVIFSSSLCETFEKSSPKVSALSNQVSMTTSDQQNQHATTNLQLKRVRSGEVPHVLHFHSLDYLGHHRKKTETWSRWDVVIIRRDSVQSFWSDIYIRKYIYIYI